MSTCSSLLAAKVIEVIKSAEEVDVSSIIGMAVRWNILVLISNEPQLISLKTSIASDMGINF